MADKPKPELKTTAPATYPYKFDQFYPGGPAQQILDWFAISRPQGPAGPAFPSTPTGGEGVQGPQGPQGIAGPAGPEGPQGVPGPAGATGPQGVAGANGPAGPQGDAGSPGVGVTGPVGPAGQDGAQGAVGGQGPQGLPGAQGPAGGAGPAGATGPAGQTVTIIGSFTNKTPADLPPSGYVPADWDSPGNPPAGNQMANGQGLLYTVTQEVCLWVGATLTPSGWVLLGDVQGPVGPQGPAGVMGPQGLQGPAGADGATGAQGLAGAAGPQGPAGVAGDVGAPGAAGPPGATGLQGAAGPQGGKGDQGTPGAQGAIGPAGAQGVQGPAGATGPAGSIGPTGTAGTPGTVGIQGPAGATGPTGPNAVSANANNTAVLGTDKLVFVPHDASLVPLAGGSMSGVLNLKGTVAADNAAAGVVGEQLSANNTAGVALTTAVTANVATLALTAGDWSVSGVVVFTSAANTVPTMLAAAVSITSATLPTAAQIAGGTGNMTQYSLGFAKGTVQIMQAGICRVNVSAATNVFLAGQSAFSGGTLSATGYISARRVR